HGRALVAGISASRRRYFPPPAWPERRRRSPLSPAPSWSRHHGAPPQDPAPTDRRARAPVSGIFADRFRRSPPPASIERLRRSPSPPTRFGSRLRAGPPQDPAPIGRHARAPVAGIFADRCRHLPLHSPPPASAERLRRSPSPPARSGSQGRG